MVKNKTQKPTFEMQKVVNPHEHMPDNIKEALFEIGRDWELSNGSYIEWDVGDEQNQEELLDDSGDLATVDQYLKTIDDWMLANGFKDGENAIILYWW
jgi:hypothetical protein